MFADPKLLLAGLCIVVVSFVFALLTRGLRARKSSREGTPSTMGSAAAPATIGAALATKSAFALPAAGGMKALPGLQTGAVRLGNGGSKTIAIVHDFGHPYGHQTDERKYLSTREAFEILAEIRSVGRDTPLDIILHTPGGEAFACELIASALKDRPNTTAYVPYCAMSAGTIIALATEKVVMGRYACLGPIDTQFFGFPVESFVRLLKEKPIQTIDDSTVLLAYLAEKELKNARQNACALLNKHHFGNDDACQLTDFLVAGDMPHSEQIGRERAAELGVNIAKDDCPDQVYKMVEARLELYRSMDSAGGQGFEMQAPNLADKRAALSAPPIMRRKP